MLGLCAWNAEKDWIGIFAGTDGFNCGEGSRGCEGEASEVVFRDEGRSIVAHDLDSV